MLLFLRIVIFDKEQNHYLGISNNCHVAKNEIQMSETDLMERGQVERSQSEQKSQLNVTT